MRKRQRLWTPRRAFKRRLSQHQPHPIYAERGNEHPLLNDLIDRDPPIGGLAEYIRDLNRNTDDKEES
jgi:hypothetical protein